MYWCRGETGIISQFVLFTFAVPAAAVAAAGVQQGSCFEVLPGGQYAVAVIGNASVATCPGVHSNKDSEGVKGQLNEYTSLARSASNLPQKLVPIAVNVGLVWLQQSAGGCSQQQCLWRCLQAAKQCIGMVGLQI